MRLEDQDKFDLLWREFNGKCFTVEQVKSAGYEVELLDDAIKRGVVFQNNDELSTCRELEYNRLKEAGMFIGDVAAHREDQQIIEDVATYDGPGEYYQVIVQDLGMAVVRTEEDPKGWMACGENNPMVYFEHFWFLHDETPETKQVRDSNGDNYSITIPRLRYYKSQRGAYLPIASLRFVCFMDRSIDPLIKEIMKIPHNVVRLRSPGDQE